MVLVIESLGVFESYCLLLIELLHCTNPFSSKQPTAQCSIYHLARCSLDCIKLVY